MTSIRVASYRISARPPEYQHGWGAWARRVRQLFYVRLWGRPVGDCRCPLHMMGNSHEIIWHLIRKKLNFFPTRLPPSSQWNRRRKS